MKLNSTNRIVLLVFLFLMVLPAAACVVYIGTFDLKSHPKVFLGLRVWCIAVVVGLFVWAWATDRLKPKR